MRILLAPVTMPLPTRGPTGRILALLAEGLKRGHELAVCAGPDGNIAPDMMPAGVRWIETPVPSPLGLPRPIGAALPRLMQILGLLRKARVQSFEQVLFLCGHLKPSFFQSDVQALRKAIRDFSPDVVFSELRLEAIVAARLENVPVVGTHSYPARADYGSTPALSEGVRRWLAAQGFEAMDSVLRLYERLDLRFVASSPELEPFPDPVVYVGPLTSIPQATGETLGTQSNRVLFYMGNGAITTKRLMDTAKAMADGPYELFVAAAGQPPLETPRLHVAPKFDFSKLLPSSTAFINHGGQNSIMQSLLSGVPLVMIPGEVFERDYNARSVVKLGAGVRLEERNFNPEALFAAIASLKDSHARDLARRAGEGLLALGGVGRVFDVLEERFAQPQP